MKTITLCLMLTSLSLTFVTTNLFGQLKSSDSEMMGLKGRVKTFSEKVYKAIPEGGLIVKGDPVLTGDSLNINEFDDRGNLLSANVPASPVFNPMDSTAYQYDRFGRCVKEVTYYPSGEIKESITNVYDEKGRLKVEIIRRSAEDEVVDAISYTYDPYGKLALKISNRKNGDMKQERYAYDKMGNWIVRVDFDEYEPLYYVERQIVYFE